MCHLIDLSEFKIKCFENNQDNLSKSPDEISCFVGGSKSMLIPNSGYNRL